MDLVDAELSDGSETDLDLPEPSSFLQMTASPQDAAERVAVSKDTEIVEMAAAPEVTVMAESEAVEAAAASGLSPKRMPRTRKTKEEATAEDALVGPKKRKTLRECKSSSNADSNVTATNPANPANFPDSLVVLTTGLTDAQLKKVHRAASQAATSATKGLPQFTVHTDLQPSTQYTHLLTSVGRDGRTTRTFKYLYALAGGAHVLRFDWLVDSVRKSQVLSEIKYAVTGDTAMKTCYLDGGLRRVPGRLFVGYRVFVWPGRWDAGSAHSQGDLLRLIQVVGADVIEGKPPGDMLAELSVGVAGDGGGSGSDVRSSTGKFAATVVSAQFRDMFELSVKCRRVVILVDAEDIKGAGGHGVLEEISELTGGLYACRTKSWLFDCISANEIL
ncbi:hypothetical protein LPJ66_007858 [Kickxella alabastrina]|uniref:Uncharacterized protein n=1 Tax=Kickxella alabastrina TaxID=61397 RepID=A0ACC1I7Q9_9FUNG|nr:hypothetical protein LPJ66_007858 [Kickxella alabastrina]